MGEIDLKDREPNYLNISIAVVALLVIIFGATYLAKSQPKTKTENPEVAGANQTTDITVINSSLYWKYPDGTTGPITNAPTNVYQAMPNESHTYVLFSVMDTTTGYYDWFVWDMHANMTTQITGSTYVIDATKTYTVTSAYEWMNGTEILVADEKTNGTTHYLKYNANNNKLDVLTTEELLEFVK